MEKKRVCLLWSKSVDELGCLIQTFEVRFAVESDGGHITFPQHKYSRVIWDQTETLEKKWSNSLVPTRIRLTAFIPAQMNRKLMATNVCLDSSQTKNVCYALKDY